MPSKNVTVLTLYGITHMTCHNLTLTKRDSWRLSRHPLVLEWHDHSVRGRKTIKTLLSYS
jgi:hypothetical protein